MSVIIPPHPLGRRDLVKEALRDRRLWDELLATEHSRSVVLEELTRIRDDVGNQLATAASEQNVRKADYDAGHLTGREFRQETADYREWHGRAVKFKGIIENRIREVRPAVMDTHRRLSAEANQYRELVIALAKGIYLHQAEALDDSALYALLEEHKVPAGLDGQVTLFELAARVLREAAA